eukprot:scaffold9816_cov99-Skeletonema_dohrnii-CCMP3373.AAC.2
MAKANMIAAKATRSSLCVDGCGEDSDPKPQQELTVDFLAELDEDQGEEFSRMDLGEVTPRQF